MTGKACGDSYSEEIFGCDSCRHAFSARSIYYMRMAKGMTISGACVNPVQGEICPDCGAGKLIFLGELEDGIVSRPAI